MRLSLYTSASLFALAGLEAAAFQFSHPLPQAYTFDDTYAPLNFAQQ